MIKNKWHVQKQDCQNKFKIVKMTKEKWVGNKADKINSLVT